MRRRLIDPALGAGTAGESGPDQNRAGGRGVILGSMRVRAELAAPGVARRFVASVLRGVIRPADIEVVVLLTSEVVTNAVIHAGTPVDLVVRGVGGGVQIEASDGTQRLPAAVVAPATSESGRGMTMVATLAEDWGVTRTATGKTVWFRCQPAPLLEPPADSVTGHHPWETGYP